MKTLRWLEPTTFSDGARTERGEKVYDYAEVTLAPKSGLPLRRVITCDTGVGFTEEYVEALIAGCMEALGKDYPQDSFAVIRVSANQIRFEYQGPLGVTGGTA